MIILFAHNENCMLNKMSRSWTLPWWLCDLLQEPYTGWYTWPHLKRNYYHYCHIFIIYLFLLVICFIDRTAEDMIGNRMKERGSDTRQTTPRPELNPGPLQWGRSLCTWDSCSTNWAKRPPIQVSFDMVWHQDWDTASTTDRGLFEDRVCQGGRLTELTA